MNTEHWKADSLSQFKLHTKAHQDEMLGMPLILDTQMFLWRFELLL